MEAQFDAGTVWYKGRVIAVSDTYDDSYSVLYDDGDREDDLEHVLIRPLPSGSSNNNKAVPEQAIAATDSPPQIASPGSSASGAAARKRMQQDKADDWSTPNALPPATLKKVRAALADILDAMDRKGEPLSVKTARTRVEKEFDKDLNAGKWKQWFKKTSEEIMDEWDEDDDDDESSESADDKATAAAKSKAKTKAAAPTPVNDTEFDTPDTTSKASLEKVRKATEDVMEIMDEKDEKMKASTIQHRTSDTLGQRKVR